MPKLADIDVYELVTRSNGTYRVGQCRQGEGGGPQTQSA